MWKIALLTSAVFAAGVTPALAQMEAQADASIFRRDRNVSVRDRPHPEYDALGLREGGFLLFPKLQTSLDYDDNIYATENDTTSDGIFEAEGSVQAVSQWSRHALNMLATVTRDQFLSHGDQSNTTYTLESDGRYDIMRNTYVTAQGEYDHAVEPRSAESATEDAKKPIQYDRGLARVKAVYAANRFQLIGDVNFVGYDYDDGKADDGSRVDQSYRNHSELRGRAEVDYAISPATAVFVTATGINFDYNNNADKRLINRDSSGYETAVGVDFEVGALIRARAEVGYRNEDYVYRGAKDVSGLNYHGQLQYFPTQLTTVTLTADRKLQDSGSIEAPAYVTNEFTAQVDHELLRNLLLTARGEYGHYKLIGIDRRDNRGGVTLGAAYLLNHGVGLNLSYSYFKQESSGANRDRDFDTNQVKLGLVLQY